MGAELWTSEDFKKERKKAVDSIPGDKLAMYAVFGVVQDVIKEWHPGKWLIGKLGKWRGAEIDMEVDPARYDNPVLEAFWRAAGRRIQNSQWIPCAARGYSKQHADEISSFVSGRLAPMKVMDRTEGKTEYAKGLQNMFKDMAYEFRHRRGISELYDLINEGTFSIIGPNQQKISVSGYDNWALRQRALGGFVNYGIFSELRRDCHFSEADFVGLVIKNDMDAEGALKLFLKSKEYGREDYIGFLPPNASHGNMQSFQDIFRWLMQGHDDNGKSLDEYLSVNGQPRYGGAKFSRELQSRITSFMQLAKGDDLEAAHKASIEFSEWLKTELGDLFLKIAGFDRKEQMIAEQKLAPSLGIHTDSRKEAFAFITNFMQKEAARLGLNPQALGMPIDKWAETNIFARIADRTRLRFSHHDAYLKWHTHGLQTPDFEAFGNMMPHGQSPKTKFRLNKILSYIAGAVDLNDSSLKGYQKEVTSGSSATDVMDELVKIHTDSNGHVNKEAIEKAANAMAIDKMTLDGHLLKYENTYSQKKYAPGSAKKLVVTEQTPQSEVVSEYAGKAKKAFDSAAKQMESGAYKDLVSYATGANMMPGLPSGFTMAQSQEKAFDELLNQFLDAEAHGDKSKMQLIGRIFKDCADKTQGAKEQNIFNNIIKKELV